MRGLPQQAGGGQLILTRGQRIFEMQLDDGGGLSCWQGDGRAKRHQGFRRALLPPNELQGEGNEPHLRQSRSEVAQSGFNLAYSIMKPF